MKCHSQFVNFVLLVWVVTFHSYRFMSIVIRILLLTQLVLQVAVLILSPLFCLYYVTGLSN